MFRVLVVDLPSPFRDSLISHLKQHLKGVCIDAVESCERARGRVAVKKPDILMVGMHLAGESGLTYAAEVTKNHPHITVMALADYDVPEYRTAAKKAGVDHLIAKDSCVGDQLAALVQHLLAGDTRPSGGKKP